jgi:hypothetical protein
MKSLSTSGVLAVALLSCAALNSRQAAAALTNDTGLNIATLSGGYHVMAMTQPRALVLEDFFSTQEGTVTLTTKTFQWGDLLSELTTNVFVAGAPALTMTGKGSLVFNVGAGQVFSTSMRLAATGPMGFGLGGFDMSFAPKLTQVPLPAGVWLLASGVALLAGGVRRRHDIHQ